MLNCEEVYIMNLSRFSLDGKVAIVTGGSRGIGRAVALGFADAGATVVIASRKQADLDMVVEEMKKKGGDGMAVAAHTGKLEEIDRLVETVKAKYGKIDILFNNAGTSPSQVNMIDAEERLWDSIINLNLKGYFLLGQRVARVMREHGGGSIINCGSVDAYRPEKLVGIYSVSKAGVLALTRTWAYDWAQYKIRANTLCPGTVKTKILDSQFAVDPEKEKWYQKKIPLGRVANPDEMVGACIFLASDASSYLTGHEIVVDGGLLIAE
jgi:NAD(P)-dependent dehydrogenase (short-subunit alcohol dehydrogenase family)